MDFSELSSISASKHGVYRVDKEYCRQHGVSPRSYSKVVAGKIRQEEIAKWYNPSKSLSWNLEYAKNNGIIVGRKALSKYCRDKGLSTDPMKIPPEQWYDESLSVSENLMIA